MECLICSSASYEVSTSAATAGVEVDKGGQAAFGAASEDRT